MCAAQKYVVVESFVGPGIPASKILSRGGLFEQPQDDASALALPAIAQGGMMIVFLGDDDAWQLNFQPESRPCMSSGTYG